MLEANNILYIQISKVKEIVAVCDDIETQERVISAISQLEATGSKVVEHDLGLLIVDIVQKAASESEKEIVKSQVRRHE